MFRLLLHGFLIGILTVLTQLGGLAWLVALAFRRRVLAFLIAYAALGVAAVYIAPQLGRTAMTCFDNGSLQVQSWFYCLTNRTYVTAELADVLQDAAAEVDRAYPGTTTMMLDGNFPFWDGFPLLPHLSHDDGEKADLAFFYQDSEGYLQGRTRAPLGYFAYEPGRSSCAPKLLDLRWDMAALQPLWRQYSLDVDRTRYLISVLARDPRVAKLFVEPHVKSTLGLSHGKIRFQGCGAARHDDHIHLQL